MRACPSRQLQRDSSISRATADACKSAAFPSRVSVSDGPDQGGHMPRGLRQKDTLAAEHFAQGRRSHHMLVCPMVPTMVTCREAALGNLARGRTDMRGGATPSCDSVSGGPDHGHMPRSVAEAPLRKGRACTGGGDMSKSGTSVPSASTQRVVAVCVKL